ncbi:MAG: YbhB/YbcL family Raf kinase inhibitor-like protein [Chlamydiae bacterium]|nr:YbhB/YbcL family Raf kinase inhibitor-like protein [Chlamydiota bacterium]
MKLSSSAFTSGKAIPRIYTCQGKNINPPLDIADVPSKAKSLVLIMDDPDVPPSVRLDRMYDHWVVFNIPPSARHIKENSMPPGILGKSTSGENEYVGPCPPDREHRYFFKLYALDEALSLQEGASKKEVLAAMKGHILEETELMGRYEQTK